MCPWNLAAWFVGNLELSFATRVDLQTPTLPCSSLADTEKKRRQAIGIAGHFFVINIYFIPGVSITLIEFLAERHAPIRRVVPILCDRVFLLTFHEQRVEVLVVT